MQLTTRETCQVLGATEATIKRWIKQLGLPAHHVAGQYRFNRTEVLEWATAHQIKVSLEIFDKDEAEDEPAPSLTDALEAGGISYGVQGTSKEGALRSLVEVLPLPDGIDREFILRLFLAREASASTAVGDGIALPHARNPIVLHVSRPLVTLAFLDKPVDFGALDGKPVQMLFSLICPTMRSHLQMLARISYVLHDEQFKATILRQGLRDEILQEARRVETAMGSQGKGIG
jgi:PTS system nitrogen regulatory IIA component